MGAVKSYIMSNQRPFNLATWELTEEIHKLTIRKIEKWKVYSSFKDNIWGTDIADM